jgi:Tol biopolymer transport system component
VCLAASAAAASRFDPALRFRRLTTAHFVIYFHQGEESLARHLSVVAEEAWRELDARIGPAPLRTHVVVTDDTDTANGFATPLAFNTIVLTASAPSGSDTIGYTDDWLRLVLTHELTHIVHLDRTRSWARVVKGVFGRVPLAFPNLFLPAWEIEGLAAYHESALTGQGRLYAGDFRAIERLGVQAGAFPMDRANGGLVAWPAGHAEYAFGLGFHEYLATQYGSDRFARLVAQSAGRVPYTASRVFKDVFGASLGTLWRDYQHALQATAFGHEETEHPIPRQLTHEGYVSVGPRYAPPACDGCPSEILYSTRNTHEFPALWATNVDGGAPRRLTERYLGSTVAVSSERLFFDEQELARNVGLYSDLYSLDRRSGRVTRLTHEARLGDPDLSSDGTRLVAVREDRGRRDLVTVPVLPGGRLGAARTIVSGADTQFAAPRWSPDGLLIVAERRAPGVSTEIVIVDAADGQVRYRARGATRAVTPTWRQDGRAVIFAADAPDGPFNLFELTLSQSQPSLRQLTWLIGGATWPDVSPDGSNLAFVGYSDQGFDIYTQPYPNETAPSSAVPSHVTIERVTSAARVSPSPHAVGPGQNAATRLADATGAAPLGDRYTPWPTLLPRAWWPFFASDADQIQGGVTTSAVDVLGYHGYSASLAWRLTEPEATQSVSGAHPDWRVVYVYDRWQPTFLLSASSSTSFLQGASAAGDGPSVLREDTASIGVSLPRQRVRHSQQLFLSVLHTTSTVTSAAARRASDRASARGAWGFTSARTFGYSISPEDGVSTGVTAEVSGPSVDQLSDARTLTADARAYLPGLSRHHVVAVRLAGGASLGGPANLRVFSLGGAAAAPDVIDFGRGAFSLLRGFPPDAFAGTRIVDANVEYRLPLLWVERGVGTWPILLRSVHAAVVVDAGHAWSRQFRATDLKLSFGAELSADAIAGYALPFTITIGAARGHDSAGRQPDRTTAYLRFGRTF